LKDVAAAIELLNNETTQSLLSSQLADNLGRSSRACSGLSDELFAQTLTARVIERTPSGRDFLQRLEECHERTIARSTFFDALQSKRRLEVIQETAQAHCSMLNRLLDNAGVDFLEDFPELAEYDVKAADGHYIEHACHTKKNSKGRLYAPGVIYVLDIRNGLIEPLSCVSDGSCKRHEMPIFRKALDRIEQKGRKTLWIGDPAFIDHPWWGSQSTKGHNVISKAKKDKSVMYCGQHPFAADDPVNVGVVRDRIGAFTSSDKMMRIIDYIDPETGEEMCFYTTLKPKIKPGVVCWLYLLRWRIEKRFDNFKNSLGEIKAWACGENALSIQAFAICMMFNFIHFLSETIQVKTGCTDEKAERKYAKSLEIREQNPKMPGGRVHPLLYVCRKISRISEQFIRTIRNYYFSEKSIVDLLPTFVRSLLEYI
jgi:hypothetical protein